MAIRSATRTFSNIAIIPAFVAVATFASTTAQADLHDTDTYSTLGCVVKNPKQRDLILPTTRGLKNRSSTTTITVFCPLQRKHDDVVACAGAQNHRFSYTAYFSIAPTISGETPGKITVLKILPTWGDEEANAEFTAQGSNEPLPSVIKQSALTPNPVDLWNGISKYTTATASVVLPCNPSSQEYAPTVRLHIPPKGYATAIQTREYSEAPGT